MKPARLILLLVAIVAGGLAAFLVTRGGGSTPEQIVTTEVIEEAKTQVLVASLPIGVGERLSQTNLQWQDWPEGAVRPEYVTIAAMPEATTDLTGAVARFEFFPGEPIREAKLAHTDQGYLSAVLAEGKRGVSVPVTAASSAGGFILPNDRVDVLLTRSTDAGQFSEVVLSNVRIMAIGKRLGEVGTSGGQEDPAASSPTPITFDDATIATLELDPAQAETLVTAATQGQLSLTLRSVADFTESAPHTTNSTQTVRLIRFGREQSINAGTTVSSVTPQAVVTPVPPMELATEDADTASSQQAQ
ncbi:Flp pilus assembly protein CpaB [Devosia submarina]|uniref:Flp pilus assembly protein CpaB n=1 Tax=Devosia submarina TaxID=1173082 RepID=UPI000D3C0660|nr:Flp pilus assembly protein CpaB [Devosia submarina]